MPVVTPETQDQSAENQHGAKAHSDGGWDASGGAFVPVQTRSDRFKSNVPSEHPDVIGREAEWKLTPVDLVRPLIDGELDGSPYAFLATQDEGADVEWIDRTDPRVGTVGQAEEKSSANAWNSFEKAMAITVTGEETSEITISRSLLGSAPRGAHTVITGTRNSRGRVILLNTGQAQLVENVEIVVEDGAHLTVVSVQEWADDALHLTRSLEVNFPGTT